MQIAVNGRFQSRRVTGVERYAQEILRYLGNKPRFVCPKPGMQGARGHLWEQFILPRQLYGDEILWSPANTGPLITTNQVLTLHDLSPLEHPEWLIPSFALWYRLFVPILVRRVQQVIVSSNYMRKKMIQRFSLTQDRVSVVPGGVDISHFQQFLPPPAGMPPNYALFVGSLHPRKNIEVLLQAWNQISQCFSNTWLLVAGGNLSISRPISIPMDVERVVFLGYVDESKLPGLYAGAQVFVYPSLDEGFGLPVLEAMACGTPVVASHAGALPEVVGDASLMFNPDSPADLIRQLELCLSNADLRRNLTEKGLAHVKSYTWQASAAIITEIFQRCQ